MLRRAASRGLTSGGALLRGGGGWHARPFSAPSAPGCLLARGGRRHAARQGGPRSVEERVIDEVERLRKAAAAAGAPARGGEEDAEASMVSFYHFANLADPEAFASELKERCEARCVLGRVLVAREGVNGAVVGAPRSVEEVLSWMRSVDALRGLRHTTSGVPRPGLPKSPFHRLQVRLKKEIITMGGRELGAEGDGALDMSNAGEHVAPEDWDDLISRDDVLLIDWSDVLRPRRRARLGAAARRARR